MTNYWKGIYGQNHAKEILSKIIASQKIPHAFLFYGPEGIGKHFTAVRFAQLLNSGFKEDFASAKESQKIEQLLEPYIKYIIPLPRGKNETGDDMPLDKLSKEEVEEIQKEIDAKAANPYYKIQIENANNVKIGSIREIRKFTNMNFDDIRYRVILISEAEKMNDTAQNALLKSLEEPPEGIIFILLTSNKSQLLDTIASRCWLVNFSPLTEGDIISILTEHFSIEKEEAQMAAVFSNGSLIKATELIHHGIKQLPEKVINILRYSLGGKYQSVYKELQPVTADSSGYTLRLILQLIGFWLADAQKNKTGRGGYFFRGHAETIEKFNQRYTAADIDQLIVRVSELENAIDNNANLNILAMNLIFDLASLKYTGI